MTQKKINLKTALLQPTNTAVPHTLFGVPVHIRRLTAGELMDYDEGLGKAQAESDQKAATLLGAQLILSALVDEQGKSVPASDLPSPAELLAAHDNAALFDAIRAIQSHSYGTLEEAEKKLTHSPWLWLIYQLADRFGEPDVRKIAALPASIIQHWEAFYSLVDKATSDTANPPPVNLSAPVASDVDEQCAAVMRALM